MTTIREIDEYMSKLAPKELSEPWDNDGVMLCGNTDRAVNTAVVCLELNLEAIKYAVQKGADVIISHHPFIFRPLKSIGSGYYSQMELLFKNSISVLSYHTRFDKAQGGVNDILAATLGLKDITVHCEFLRCGSLECEMNGEQLATYLKAKLGLDSMKAYFEKDAKIKRVSVCGGAGKDFLRDAAEISDAYISADFSHNTFIDAKELGVAIFDAGHYHTENPAARKLCRDLCENFSDVTFDFFDVGSPFFNI